MSDHVSPPEPDFSGFDAPQQEQLRTWAASLEHFRVTRANRLRRNFAIGYSFLAIGLVLAGGEIYRLVEKIDSSQTSQLSNRVSNVHSWCTAINSLANDSRAVVQHFGVVGTFKHNNLNCTVLEHNTHASAKG